MIGTVAIIGAGTAGLVAAECLRNANFEVSVFEKSRGVGGRMATRRRDGFSFDHGAQFVDAKTPEFKHALEAWNVAGVVEPWFKNCFVGIPGMSGIANALSKDQNILFGCRVTQLHRYENGWGLKGESETDAPTLDRKFDAVIVAIPSPQTVELLQTADVNLPELEQTRYEPCLAMMAAFAEPIAGIPDRLSPNDPVIAWLARNSSKPSRPQAQETFVVHATADWSRRHLDKDHDDIAQMLLERFHKLSGVQPEPTLLMGHRWKYALVSNPMGKPYIWKSAIGLGACGDWCLGPRIEDAFLSGREMAEQIISTGKFP
ncbi:MAG: FAD-dependent oxidoreductase [Filomicrobium sp.]